MTEALRTRLEPLIATWEKYIAQAKACEADYALVHGRRRDADTIDWCKRQLEAALASLPPPPEQLWQVVYNAAAEAGTILDDDVGTAIAEAVQNASVASLPPQSEEEEAFTRMDKQADSLGAATAPTVREGCPFCPTADRVAGDTVCDDHRDEFAFSMGRRYQEQEPNGTLRFSELLSSICADLGMPDAEPPAVPAVAGTVDEGTAPQFAPTSSSSSPHPETTTPTTNEDLSRQRTASEAPNMGISASAEGKASCD